MKKNKEIKEVYKKNKKDKKVNKIKQKVKVSDIFLYIAIVLTFAYLIFTVVDLFRSISTKELSVFTANFLLSFIMIIVSTIFYLFLLYFEKSKYEFPEWFKCIIIVSIFVFSIIYTMFNLYTKLAFSIIFYIVVGFMLSLIAISIFYNYLKDSKNIVKISPFMVFLFSVCFSISIGVIIQLIIFLTKDLNKLQTTATPLYLDFYINLGVIFTSSLITSFVMFISLKKDKRLINSCIIYKKI